MVMKLIGQKIRAFNNFQSKKKRRQVLVPIHRNLTVEEFKGVLDRLPQDAVVGMANYSFQHETSYLLLEHRSFDECPEGSITPFYCDPLTEVSE